MASDPHQPGANSRISGWPGSVRRYWSEFTDCWRRGHLGAVRMAPQAAVLTSNGGEGCGTASIAGARESRDHTFDLAGVAHIHGSCLHAERRRRGLDSAEFAGTQGE